MRALAPIQVLGREKDHRPFIFEQPFTSLHYVKNIILQENFASKMVSNLGLLTVRALYMFINVRYIFSRTFAEKISSR
jgi:hypothetical protein